MESFLRKPITVPFDSLYLDPNNPRLALDDPPGYEDVAKIVDAELQKTLEQKIEEVYQVDALEQAIFGQGWMPIDNIVVWTYPNHPDRHVVVEGNRRTVALRRIRTRLSRERDRLGRMKDGRKRHAPHDITEQEQTVEKFERIVADTNKLTVVPLDADTVDELKRKLPRVLAVRHVTGAKEWGSYAEDLWLLTRYGHLFEVSRPGQDLRWDSALITQVANEASLGSPLTKRKLLAASCFSHFKGEFEDELPKEESFEPSDYYLFENIVKRPWLRTRFDLGEDDLRIPDDRQRTIFAWVFKQLRGKTADENPNVFYRHENVLLWDQMRRYDDKNSTAFAQRFDVTDPDSAPRMHEVEADYLAHKARRRPADVLEQLLQQLSDLSAEALMTQGAFLKAQLERLGQRTEGLLRMIAAVEKA